MASEDDLDRRFDPVFQRGHEDDAPVRLVPHASPERSEPAEVVVAAPSMRGNPWARVLWVTSLALLVLGIAAQWYSSYLVAAPQLDSVMQYYVVPAVLSALSPWFIAVGLASLAGLLFLYAIRWRRR